MSALSPRATRGTRRAAAGASHDHDTAGSEGDMPIALLSPAKRLRTACSDTDTVLAAKALDGSRCEDSDGQENLELKMRIFETFFPDASNRDILYIEDGSQIDTSPLTEEERRILSSFDTSNMRLREQLISFQGVFRPLHEEVNRAHAALLQTMENAVVEECDPSSAACTFRVVPPAGHVVDPAHPLITSPFVTIARKADTTETFTFDHLRQVILGLTSDSIAAAIPKTLPKSISMESRIMKGVISAVRQGLVSLRKSYKLGVELRDTPPRGVLEEDIQPTPVDVFHHLRKWLQAKEAVATKKMEKAKALEPIQQQLQKRHEKALAVMLARGGRARLMKMPKASFPLLFGGDSPYLKAGGPDEPDATVMLRVVHPKPRHAVPNVTWAIEATEALFREKNGIRVFSQGDDAVRAEFLQDLVGGLQARFELASAQELPPKSTEPTLKFTFAVKRSGPSGPACAPAGASAASSGFAMGSRKAGGSVEI
jgi:hypothetical protein